MAEKILVVDDDLDSLKLIGLMLQRQGYRITAASSGTQALSKAHSEKPDLIILDVMMPDMDGYEVCRRLRADPDTQDIPIIMFTAKTLVDDKVAGFEAGADDYLTKPTHPAELASRVKAILARAGARKRAVAQELGSILSFIGTKGGVGTTTLALNVAAALVQRDTNTIIADLRPGQGTLGLLLGFSSSTGLANLATKNPAEITPKAVESELVPHSSGLKLLLSSARPSEMQLRLTPDVAEMIVKHLATLAKVVVLDLGSGLTLVNRRILGLSTHTVLAVEPIRVDLMMAREQLEEMSKIGVGRARVSIVMINRAPSSLQISWQEAEQILDHEISAIISPAPELAFQASEAGFPMILYQPNSIVASQLNKLADELAPRL